MSRWRGSGRHLQCKSREAGVRRVVCRSQIVLDPAVAVLARDLGDVDRRFDGFDLTEEQLLVALFVRPIGKQARCRARNADIPAVRHAPTRWRIRSTTGFASMRSFVHSVSNWSCLPFFFARGIGTKCELGRRPDSISFVMPSSSNLKWRVGSLKGESRMGLSMTDIHT